MNHNLLLRFYLSIDYWIVDPKLITCLHYWWGTSFNLSCIFEWILHVTFDNSSLDHVFMLFYEWVWLYVEPYILYYAWHKYIYLIVIVYARLVRIWHIDIIYTLAFLFVLVLLDFKTLWLLEMHDSWPVLLFQLEPICPRFVILSHKPALILLSVLVKLLKEN